MSIVLFLNCLLPPIFQCFVGNLLRNCKDTSALLIAEMQMTEHIISDEHNILEKVSWAIMEGFAVFLQTLLV